MRDCAIGSGRKMCAAKAIRAKISVFLRTSGAQKIVALVAYAKVLLQGRMAFFTFCHAKSVANKKIKIRFVDKCNLFCTVFLKGMDFCH